MERRVVITGMGIWSCLGTDIESVKESLYTGKSGIGRIDEHGMLHLSGREDDVINVGGFKVAPTEVEDAAMSFHGITDCICISVKHLITGYALKLLVVMADGESLNKRELALHLKSKLEPYKIPMLYEQVTEVRRTYNGKLDRKSYVK